MNISNKQLRAVGLPLRHKRIKIQLLDFDYRVVDEVEGVCVGGTLSKDAQSDLRRNGSVTMAIPIDKNATTFLDSVQGFTISVGGKVWIDRYVKIFIGIDDYTTVPTQTVWYKFGVCLIDQPSRVFSATDYTISFNVLDLMGRLTGLRQGQLNTLTTVFEQGAATSAQHPCNVDSNTEKVTVNSGDYFFASTINKQIQASAGTTTHTETLATTIADNKRYAMLITNKVTALNAQASAWALEALIEDYEDETGLASDFYYFFEETRVDINLYAAGWYRGNLATNKLTPVGVPDFQMPFNADSVFGSKANTYFEPYQCATICNEICSTAVYERNETHPMLESVISELAGIKRYNIYPLPEKYKYLPYDIKVGIGATVFDILSEFMKILSTWQMYFDDDGVLIIEPIPSGIYSPVIPLSKERLISSDTSFDFQNVKNQVTVYGRLNSAVAFGTMEYGEGTTSGYITFDTLQPTQWSIGATVLAFETPDHYNTIELEDLELDYTDGNGEAQSISAKIVPFEKTDGSIAVNELVPKTIYCVRLSDATIDANGSVQLDYPITFEFLGKQQVAATLVNDNKQSPYYINADLPTPNYFCGTAFGYGLTLNDSDNTVTALKDGTLLSFMADISNTEGQQLTVYSSSSAQVAVGAMVNNDSSRSPLTADKMIGDYTIWLVRYDAVKKEFVFLGRHPYALVKVLTSGEYDNIYADQLAAERCQWELFKASSLNNSIKIGIIPDYVLDVNCKIPFKDSWATQPDAPVSEDEPTAYYLIKAITYPLGLDSTAQDITAIQVYDDDNLVGNDYEIPTTIPLDKLSTPVNLDATDSSVSWDAVENATEYEVVVDNASWGICEPTVYDYTQDGDTVTIQTAPYTQDGDTVTIK